MFAEDEELVTARLEDNLRSLSRMLHLGSQSPRGTIPPCGRSRRKEKEYRCRRRPWATRLNLLRSIQPLGAHPVPSGHGCQAPVMPRGLRAGGDLLAPRVHAETTGAEVQGVGTSARKLHQTIHSKPARRRKGRENSRPLRASDNFQSRPYPHGRQGSLAGLKELLPLVNHLLEFLGDFKGIIAMHAAIE